MSSPLLRVEHLAVSFSIQGRRLHAVRGVSFELFPGEAVGLVGESGCGKSVTAQALLKLGGAQNVTGKAFFDGEDLSFIFPF